jgi:hypothetical protein
VAGHLAQQDPYHARERWLLDGAHRDLR